MTVTWLEYQIAEIIRRMSFPVPRVTWTPVRFVQDDQVCSLCFNVIQKGKPGTTTGSRGTRAWYCPEHRVWECMECRSQAFEAEHPAAATPATSTLEPAA